MKNTKLTIGEVSWSVWFLVVWAILAGFASLVTPETSPGWKLIGIAAFALPAIFFAYTNRRAPRPKALSELWNNRRWGSYLLFQLGMALVYGVGMVLWKHVTIVEKIFLGVCALGLAALVMWKIYQFLHWLFVGEARWFYALNNYMYAEMHFSTQPPTNCVASIYLPYGGMFRRGKVSAPGWKVKRDMFGFTGYWLVAQDGSRLFINAEVGASWSAYRMPWHLFVRGANPGDAISKLCEKIARFQRDLSHAVIVEQQVAEWTAQLIVKIKASKGNTSNHDLTELLVEARRFLMSMLQELVPNLEEREKLLGRALLHLQEGKI